MIKIKWLQLIVYILNCNFILFLFFASKRYCVLCSDTNKWYAHTFANREREMNETWKIAILMHGNYPLESFIYRTLWRINFRQLHSHNVNDQYCYRFSIVSKPFDWTYLFNSESMWCLDNLSSFFFTNHNNCNWHDF